MRHVSSLPPPPPPPAAPFGATPPPFGVAPSPFGPSHEIRPRASWYFIVLGIGFVAAVLGVVLIVSTAIGFANKIDDFHRIDVPGTQTIVLDAGAYTVYLEGAGGADITIRKANEQLVPLRPYSSEVSYEVSGHDGRAAFSFRADEAGQYRVTATGASGAVVAIGPGLGSGLVGGILGGVGLILGGIAFAVIGSIIVGVKRGKSRRSRIAGAYGGFTLH